MKTLKQNIKILMAMIVFAIAGTMHAQHVWNSATVPIVANNATVTIMAGAAGTLIVPENATVTINSTGMVNNSWSTITLNISPNARVVWRADYSSTNAITVVGTGTFEVASGSILNTTMSSSAITTSSNSTIIVSGGTINSQPFWSAVINSSSASGRVIVSGGEVRAAGTGNGRQAISVAGILEVTGGLVIAELTNAVGANGVVSRTPNSTPNTGLIIGYTLGGSHAVGGITGLSVWPFTGANVSWGLRNGWETGINYGSNFTPRSGVSVGNRIVWNSNRLPTASPIATGAIVTIAEGASGTLNVPANVNVTIESRGIVDNGSREIHISIGSNAHVTWRANYTLNISGWAGTSILVGGGTFEIAEGSIIKNFSGSGGSRNIISSFENTLVISGGLVSSTGTGLNTITGSTSTIRVLNGEVRTTTGTAINTTDASSIVEISGGVVSATTGQAINAHASGIFNVTGGLVIAQRGTLIGSNGVVSRAPNTVSGNGTVVGYTCGAHGLNSRDGLVSQPVNVASWGISGGQARVNSPGGFHVIPAGCVTFPTRTVTFNPNGGTPTPPSVTVTQGGILTSLPTVSRTGFGFAGWFTQATGGTEVTTSTPIDTDMTVWARWTLLSPPAPTLSTPANNATNQSRRPTLTWNRPSGEVTGYRIYRGTSANPSSNVANRVATINNPATTSWTHQADLALNTTFHWQVVAFNSGGDSPASASRSFTTQVAPPGQVIVTAPAINATNEPLRPTLTWNAVAGATSYHIYKIPGSSGNPFNPNNVSQSRVATISNPATTSWTPTSNLLPNTTYRWQVVASNGTQPHNFGTASVARNFTTLLTPPLPTITLSSPANNATNQSLTPTLVWLNQANTPARTGIHVYIGTTNPPFNPSNPTENRVATLGANATFWTVVAGLLEYYTVYFWQIVPFNNAGLATGGTVRNFRTQMAPRHRITFDATGGNVTPAFDSTGIGGVLAYLPTPTKIGHSFNGWFTSAINGEEITTNTVFSADATIFAQWTINTYTVTFNSRGGSAIDEQIIAHGSKVTMPTYPPTRTDFTFGGWFRDAEIINVWDFYTDVIISDTVLYAKWVSNPTLLDSIVVLLDSIDRLNQLLTACEGDLVETLLIASLRLDTISWLRQLLAECENSSTNVVGEHVGSPLQIYPNPVTNVLHITHEWQSGDVVELFDMNGRRVFSQPVIEVLETTGGFESLSHRTATFTIDMSPFPNGNYILRIGNRVAKIVKR